MKVEMRFLVKRTPKVFCLTFGVHFVANTKIEN